MMRFLCVFVFVMMPVMGIAQSLKPNGGYKVQWRAMQVCLQRADGPNADVACVEQAITYCKRAGNFEGCLDSLIKWVGNDIEVMNRRLGGTSTAIVDEESICSLQAALPGPMCAARDATNLLLHFRHQMRVAGFHPDQIERPIFHPRPILDCIDAARGSDVALNCVGEGALSCWHAENGAGPPDTIEKCLDAELSFWTQRMDISVSKLPEHHVMQTQWETSRASRCDMVAALNPGGVMHADCMVQLTGRHVLWLEGLVKPQ